MNCSMEQPGGKRCAYGRRAACVVGHSKQHLGLVAHSALRAEVGRMGDWQPLVLPSGNGKLVAPHPELENTAHLR